MQVEALDLSLKVIKTESEVVKLDLSTEPAPMFTKTSIHLYSGAAAVGDRISRFWVKVPKIDFL